MRKMKKNIGILLCTLLLCLCGCGKNAPAASVPISDQPPAPTAVPEITAAPQPTPLPIPTAEEQLRIFLADPSLWLVPREPYSSEYFYAVTDLDRNGRLEILEASTQGTGIFTYGTLYEVNRYFAGIEEIPLLQGEGDNIPEIIVSTADCYHDAAGRYFYVFQNVARNGMAEHYEARESICLEGGYITREIISSQYSAPEGEKLVTTYRDSTGATVDESRYQSAESSFFAGMEKSTASFGWFLYTDSDLNEMLTRSWQVFSGELAAMPEDATAMLGAIVTPEPTASP